MTQWWQDLTDREKFLLAAMSGIIFCMLVYVVVIRPLTTYRQNARDYFDSAFTLHVDVSEAADTLSQLAINGAMRASRDDQPVRVLASARARELGLSVIRIQPMDNGTVSFWLNDGNTASLFEWIVGLQSDHGIMVARADLQRMVDGRAIQAQVVLRKAQ